MGERIELDIDFRSDSAAQGILRLIDLLSDLQSSSGRAGTALGGLETSADSAGKSTGQSADGIAAMDKKASAAAKSADDLAAGLDKTANNASSIKNEKMGALADDTDRAATSSSSLEGSLGKIAGHLAAMGSIGVIASALEESAAKNVEVRNELVDEKVSFDRRAQVASANLRRFGDAGIQQTKAQAFALTQRTGINPDVTLALLGSGNTVGFDPDKKEGAGVIEQVAKAASLAGPEGIRPADAEMFLKYLRLRGVKDGADAEKEAASAMEMFFSSGTTNFGQFIGGMLQGVESQVRRGATPDAAKARFGGMVTMEKSVQKANQTLEIVQRAAEGRDSNAVAFLASLAASRGQTKVSDVTDGQVEAAIAKGATPEARSVADRRQRLVRSREDDNDQESKLRASIEEMKHDLTRATGANVAERRHDLQHRIAATEADLEKKKKRSTEDHLNDQKELDRHTEVLRGKLVADAQIAAFREMSFDDKVKLLVEGYRDAAKHGPQALAEFKGKVTSIEEQRRVDTFVSDAAQKEIGRVDQANRSADPRQFRQDVAKSFSAAPAQRTIADLKATMIKEGVVTPGEEYASNIQKQSEARVKAQQAKDGFWQGWSNYLWDKTVNVASSKDGAAQTSAFVEEVQNDMRAYAQTLTPAEFAASGIDKLYGELRTEDTGIFLKSKFFRPDSKMRDFRDVAAKFGELKSKIEAQRQAAAGAKASPPAAPIKPAPSTRPSTQPTTAPAAEPHADAADVNHHYEQTHYNVSVGNLWTSPGGDIDLPGPFDRGGFI